jgi:hypothetical protein
MYIKCAQEGCNKKKNRINLSQTLEILKYENDKKAILDRIIKKVALDNPRTEFTFCHTDKCKQILDVSTGKKKKCKQCG